MLWQNSNSACRLVPMISRLAVANELRTTVDTELIMDDQLVLMLFSKAIVLHENGRPPLTGPWPENWYADDVYQRAAALALKKTA